MSVLGVRPPYSRTKIITVSLGEQQVMALKAMHRVFVRQRISISELVRTAIDDLCAKLSRMDTDDAAVYVSAHGQLPQPEDEQACGL